jgi:hypothetical protein
MSAIALAKAEIVEGKAERHRIFRLLCTRFDQGTLEDIDAYITEFEHKTALVRLRIHLLTAKADSEKTKTAFRITG